MKKQILKNRMIWLAWILISVVLHLFGNSYAALAVLVSSVFIPPVFAVLVFFSTKKINVDLKIGEGKQFDQTMRGSLTVSKNKSLLPIRTVCFLRCKNLMTGELSEEHVIVLVQKNKTAQFSFSSVHCGSLRITVHEAFACDFFGLIACPVSKSAPCEIVIPPKIFPMDIYISEETAAPYECETYSEEKPGADSSETYAVREYIPGDPMKSIHWKLSKKTDKLMVREYGFPISNQILLVFKTDFPQRLKVTPSQLHAMAEVFVSVSHALISGGSPHTVEWTNTKTKKTIRHKIMSKDDLTAVLPSFLSNPICPFFEPLKDRLDTKSYDFAHIAVISSYMPQEFSVLTNKKQVTLLLSVNGFSQSLPDIRTISFLESGYRSKLASFKI